MSQFRDLLLGNEPLLLFVVIGLGYLLGQLKIKEFGLGVSGVLFVGLLFGGWRPQGTAQLQITSQIKDIGLIIFVYVIGIGSGSGFFASFKSRGIRFNLVVVLTLILGAAATLAVGMLLKISVSEAAGIFCGGLTTTPALGALSQLVKSIDPTDINGPAVGYSISYPFGIVGGLLAMHVFFRILRRQAKKEIDAATGRAESSRLVVQNFTITNPEIFGKAIGELRIRDELGLMVSRHRHGSRVTVATKYSILNKDDIIVTVGKKEEMEKAAKFFGKRSREHLEYSRETIDYRRILVSRKELAGKTIRELDLDTNFNAQIVRLRRADIDIVPDENTLIELGDRLRVVMPSHRIGEVSQFFGDSERGIAELDYTAITLGISAGVLLGMIRIPLTQTTSVSLGLAGGPLVMGLVLGRLGRTGRFLWSIPLESAQALSHFGLLLFLAAVGVSAGGKFFDAMSVSGVKMLIVGLATTTVTLGLNLALLRILYGTSIVDCMGATGGVHTQPATLSCAYQLTRSNDVYVAYTTTYPVAMIGKIILAQLIYVIGLYLLPV